MGHDMNVTLGSGSAVRSVDHEGTWLRVHNNQGDEVELMIKGLTADKLRAAMEPVKPIAPSDYRPSPQVQHVISMLDNSDRAQGGRRRNDFSLGSYNGMCAVLRELVELETGIDDPEVIDELCADLISEDKINLW